MISELELENCSNTQPHSACYRSASRNTELPTSVLAEIALLSRISLSPPFRTSPSLLSRIIPPLPSLFSSLSAQQIPISPLMLIQQGRRCSHALHGQWSAWLPLAPRAADPGVQELKDELRQLWAGWSHGARAIGGGAAMGAD